MLKEQHYLNKAASMFSCKQILSQLRAQLIDAQDPLAQGDESG